MEIDIISNLSTLTSIPKNTLNKLIEKTNWCICDSIYASNVLNKEDTVLLNVGIGTISIYNDGESIKYKFLPSKQLENSIRDTIVNKTNPLKLTLEKNLIDKLSNTYKDII